MKGFNSRVLPLLLVAFTGGCSLIPQQPESTTATKQEVPAKPKVVREFEPDTLYDLLLAEIAGQRKRYDIALGNYLEQAKQTKDPGVAERALQIAQFLGARQAALEASNLWLDAAPKNPSALQANAIELARAGDLEQATEKMLQVLAEHGNTNFELIAAQATQLSIEDREKLLGTFDRALSQYPDNQQLMLGRALLLQQNGENQKALEIVQELRSNGDKDPRLIQVEARLLHSLQRDPEAAKLLKQSVQKYPDDSRMRLLYARILVAQGQLEDAQLQFETLLQDAPNDPELLLSIALIALENGYEDQAEGYLERLLETGEHLSTAHFYLARIAQQQDNWQEARKHYLEVTNGPDYLPAQAELTRILAEHNQFTQARAHLAKARDQHPNLAASLYLIEAETLIEFEQYKTASKVLQTALKLYPDNVNLLYSRAMLAEKQDKLDRLEQDLRAILKREPNNYAALNALGYTLADRTERLEEAGKLIQRAYELKPSDPAIIDSMGWLQYRLGNNERALKLLEEAYRQYPDPEVAAHYGEVLWVMGQQDKARKVWSEALKRAPDNELVTSTIKRLTGSK